MRSALILAGLLALYFPFPVFAADDREAADEEASIYYLAPFIRHWHSVYVLGEDYASRLVIVRPHIFLERRLKLGQRSQGGVYTVTKSELRTVTKREFDSNFFEPQDLEIGRRRVVGATDSYGYSITSFWFAGFFEDPNVTPSDLLGEYQATLEALQGDLTEREVIRRAFTLPYRMAVHPTTENRSLRALCGSIIAAGQRLLRM